MEVYINTLEEATIGGFTHQAIITYQDLQALAAGATGATAAFTLAQLCGAGSSELGAPVAAYVGRVALYLKTPFVFSDGSLISSTLTVTDGTNTLLAATETDSAGSYVTVAAANNNQAYKVATSVLAEFTPTATHNLNTATAGEVHLLLEIVNLASDIEY